MFFLGPRKKGKGKKGKKVKRKIRTDSPAIVHLRGSVSKN